MHTIAHLLGIEGAHGSEPLAVLVLRDERADPESIIRHANETLARHQQMRRWFVWPQHDFPRTATQKVRRHEVAATVKAQLSGPNASDETPSDELAKVITQITGAPTTAGPWPFLRPARANRDCRRWHG